MSAGKPLEPEVRELLRSSEKIKLSIGRELYDDAHAAMAKTDIRMFTGWIRAAMVEKITRDAPSTQTAMIEQTKRDYNRREQAKDRAKARRKAKA